MRNDLFLKQMGSKVKAARLANKMSLPQLSKATGFGIPAIWFLEQGRRNAHVLTLKAIADVLKMEVKDFI
ncbi:MAG: helix-turn-helix domain-containing protein [Flavisolibacter sp.]